MPAYKIVANLLHIQYTFCNIKARLALAEKINIFYYLIFLGYYLVFFFIIYDLIGFFYIIHKFYY